VKFKLDENLPLSSARSLAKSGHDVDTVAAEGLTGAADPDVVAAATEEERVLITLDRGMGDIRAYPPGSHAGIVVRSSRTRRRPATCSFLCFNRPRSHPTRLAILRSGHPSDRRRRDHRRLRPRNYLEADHPARYSRRTLETVKHHPKPNPAGGFGRRNAAWLGKESS
jgi:hypothetical protein